MAQLLQFLLGVGVGCFQDFLYCQILQSVGKTAVVLYCAVSLVYGSTAALGKGCELSNIV